MRGLDVIGADSALGISWGDVGDAGKAAFPYIHATGKGLASAFGAGAAADALESVEQKQGWLPATMPATAATVTTTTQSIAKAATPKFQAALVKEQPKTKASSEAAGETKTHGAKSAASPPTKVGVGDVVVGAGILGVFALVIHRLWIR
jgi:hypothetical protein